MNLNISEEWLRKHSDKDEGCISVGGLYARMGFFKSYNTDEMINPNPVTLSSEKEKELRERMSKLLVHSEEKQQIIDDAISYVKGIPLALQEHSLSDRDIKIMSEVAKGKREIGKYLRTPKRIKNATKNF